MAFTFHCTNIQVSKSGAFSLHMSINTQLEFGVSKAMNTFLSECMDP